MIKLLLPHSPLKSHQSMNSWVWLYQKKPLLCALALNFVWKWPKWRMEKRGQHRLYTLQGELKVSELFSKIVNFDSPDFSHNNQTNIFIIIMRNWKWLSAYMALPTASFHLPMAGSCSSTSGAFRQRAVADASIVFDVNTTARRGRQPVLWTCTATYCCTQGSWWFNFFNLPLWLAVWPWQPQKLQQRTRYRSRFYCIWVHWIKHLFISREQTDQLNDIEAVSLSCLGQ